MLNFYSPPLTFPFFLLPFFRFLGWSNVLGPQEERNYHRFYIKFLSLRIISYSCEDYSEVTLGEVGGEGDLESISNGMSISERHLRKRKDKKGSRTLCVDRLLT